MLETRAQFTLYNLTTGALGQFHDLDVSLVERATPEGFGRIEGQHNPQTHFVVDGGVVPKTAFEPEIEGRSIVNLPIPCSVLILPGGETATIDDGSLELDAELPGPYRALIRSAPYLDCWVELP